jgi:outer membrane protein assembly factor BamB
MSKFRIVNIIFVLLSHFYINGQESETLIKSDFTIRDFIIEKDSIIFLKKRDLILENRHTGENKKEFTGGYGLELLPLKNTNTIITISNELNNKTSFVRFYNKSKQVFDYVYYNKQGNAIDFLLMPNLKLFALSLVSNTIIIIDYSKAPRFFKTIEIKNSAMSRRLFYQNNNLYYVTDNGAFYAYNINTYKKTRIFKTDSAISDFILNDGIVTYTTLTGDIIKRNLNTALEQKIQLKNDFVTTLSDNDKFLLIGTWLGNCIVVEKQNFKVISTTTTHKKPILKLLSKNSEVYSSSIDGTIKKLNLSIN